MSDEGCNILLNKISEQLERIIRGEIGAPVSEESCDETSVNELCRTVNRLIETFNGMREFIGSLAEGNLDVQAPPRNLLASPFKQLQANLLHLAWQTRQVAAGDFSQRVQFLGVFSTAFNSMVEALEDKRRTEIQLRETEDKVKHLEGIIPICMYCKKIRDDMESWQQLEKYITEHSEAMFSHGICPECYVNMKDDLKHNRKKRD